MIDLKDLFKHQIHGLHLAEKQSIASTPEMISNATKTHKVHTGQIKEIMKGDQNQEEDS